MEVIYDRVAGLDVHKETVVATVRVMVGRKAEHECRTFETTTAGLSALLAWLTETRCSHVAMEATGVYWKPVWNILSDGAFELIVANAAHIKNVPGRKTDVNDATWIADLLACGLIRGSFVPSETFQELRALQRTRKQLTREQTRHVQRLQKTLEEANIKLDSVISDIMGLSGRRMIEAIIAGVRSPRKLADLADRRRQTQVLKIAEGRALAEDDARPMRGVRQQQKGQLFQGAVPAPQKPSRRAESFLRSRRIAADHDLSYAQGRYAVPGSWKGPFRQAPDEGQGQPSPRPTRQARLSG